MKFGRTLRNTVISKWESHYVDYTKLKNLLKEDIDKHTQWTENDENKFCDAIFNVELNKVADFHEETFKKLESRTKSASTELQKLASESVIAKNSKVIARFKEIESILDDIITETKDLKKYSEINYTAFLKIVKKHDRKRGNNYKIRPLLLMSLNKRPFNSVQRYTPLLTKLSVLYYVVRQHLDEESDVFDVTASEHSRLQNGERYTAYKFWIHPENLLEVKTYILRRLPVLIYSQVSSKNPEAAQIDPAINSLYFDSPEFNLYNSKVNSQVTSSSLRLRWFGQLNVKPEVVIEQKTVYENGTSEERRFPIKEKYIQSFIKGDYKMEKSIAKMERQGQPEAKIQEFKKTVSDIQKLILDNKLQPVLRANYSRTAFQKPLDDKVRISIDTNLVFIREDSLDLETPCRDFENWHRLDVDNMHINCPFENLDKGDVNRFPYALLEIKVKDEDGKENPKWIEDLMASHLVHEIPRFSKFVHGVVVLFEDHVNYLPYWLSDLEIEIRKDPQAAFEEEKQQKAKRDENDQLVGSLLGTSKMTASSQKADISPSLGKSYSQERLLAEDEPLNHQSDLANKNLPTEPSDEAGNLSYKIGGYGTMASIFPSFSSSRYAKFHRRSVALPPGVTKPELLIKESGPIQVEPKVWLANERTFVKWMQIAIQLAILGVGLNSAGSATRTEDKKITSWFGAVFVIIAAFTGCWGLYMQRVRRRLIFERSGKDFDNWIGPLVVGFSFLLALSLNFLLKFRAVKDRNTVESISQSVYDQTRFTEL